MENLQAIGERATIAISAPLMTAGLGAVALAGTWAERGVGAVLVAGGAVALGSGTWTARAVGWTVAAAGALMLASLS